MTIAVSWARRLGHRSFESFYKGLAIAILVEEYGVNHTARIIKKPRSFVSKYLEVYNIASQPSIETNKAEYGKLLKKLIKLHGIREVSRRLNKPVEDLIDMWEQTAT